ncbi:hypothetical protein K1719_017074 [Acacia pycnantha]|nr:hypothetical protein K1719_017074 [Acacia pycnantha]
MKGFVSGVAMIVLLSTVLFPSIAMAKVYIVGDEHGWRGGVDYQAWAANKSFFVGDILGIYVPGKDHVYLVGETEFEICLHLVGRGLSSGNDFVRLAYPDRQWFIGDHCHDGQKLMINVTLPFAFPPLFPPAPSPFHIKP